LITLPFLAVVILLVVGLLKTPVTLMLGNDVTGRVDEVRPSRRAGANRFDVVYSYTLSDGPAATGSGTIDTGGAPPPAPGQTVPLRVLRIGSFHRAELRNRNVAITGYVCGGLFVLVWGGFIVLFTIGAWFGPRAERHLIRNGDVTEGIIAEKRQVPGRRYVQYEVLYRFRTRNNEDRSGILPVTAAAYAQMSEGQTVTVFYHPSKPGLSRLYNNSDFAIVGFE
jgi:hypothetical protein